MNARIPLSLCSPSSFLFLRFGASLIASNIREASPYTFFPKVSLSGRWVYGQDLLIHGASTCTCRIVRMRNSILSGPDRRPGRIFSPICIIGTYDIEPNKLHWQKWVKCTLYCTILYVSLISYQDMYLSLCDDL